jgi:hypothetical protein
VAEGNVKFIIPVNTIQAVVTGLVKENEFSGGLGLKTGKLF